MSQLHKSYCVHIVSKLHLAIIAPITSLLNSETKHRLPFFPSSSTLPFPLLFIPLVIFLLFFYGKYTIKKSFQSPSIKFYLSKWPESIYDKYLMSVHFNLHHVDSEWEKGWGKTEDTVSGFFTPHFHPFTVNSFDQAPYWITFCNPKTLFSGRKRLPSLYTYFTTWNMWITF